MRVIFSYTRQTKTPALRLGSFARTPLAKRTLRRKRRYLFLLARIFPLYRPNANSASLGVWAVLSCEDISPKTMEVVDYLLF